MLHLNLFTNVGKDQAQKLKVGKRRLEFVDVDSGVGRTPKDGVESRRAIFGHCSIFSDESVCMNELEAPGRFKFRRLKPIQLQAEGLESGSEAFCLSRVDPLDQFLDERLDVVDHYAQAIE
jgi:hypothetical protein